MALALLTRRRRLISQIWPNRRSRRLRMPSTCSTLVVAEQSSQRSWRLPCVPSELKTHLRRRSRSWSKCLIRMGQERLTSMSSWRSWWWKWHKQTRKMLLMKLSNSLIKMEMVKLPSKIWRQSPKNLTRQWLTKNYLKCYKEPLRTVALASDSQSVIKPLNRCCQNQTKTSERTVS